MKARKNAGRKGRKLGPYGRKTAAKVILCGLPGDPGTQGKPPTKAGKCPDCGSPAVGGFGLAFGGYGPYYTCQNEAKCKWYFKEVLKESEA